jgi:uncharacterized protein (TIGR03083 family)
MSDSIRNVGYQSESNGPGPILCAHLLRTVDEKLLELLASLRPEEWALQTVAPDWKVRDVAAHLLDTVLRKLSMVRDNWFVEQPATGYPEDLAALVNRLNREGVTVYRRLSPPVLISLLSRACRDSADFHEALDPFAPAAFAVSWAGQERSLNWFDTARELTERWHHQQQIRLATGRPGLMVPELYHPVLDCFMRGLPFCYRNLDRALGTMVRAEISGECGGVWQIRKEVAGWALVKPTDQCDSRVIVPQGIAWLVFTKAIPPDRAELQIRIEGDRELGNQVLALTAIVS